MKRSQTYIRNRRIKWCTIPPAGFVWLTILKRNSNLGSESKMNYMESVNSLVKKLLTIYCWVSSFSSGTAELIKNLKTTLITFTLNYFIKAEKNFLNLFGKKTLKEKIVKSLRLNKSEKNRRKRMKKQKKIKEGWKASKDIQKSGVLMLEDIKVDIADKISISIDTENVIIRYLLWYSLKLAKFRKIRLLLRYQMWSQRVSLQREASPKLQKSS